MRKLAIYSGIVLVHPRGNQRIADWSGSPAITCKNGNFAQNQCEFLLGTASQSVTATLK